MVTLHITFFVTSGLKKIPSIFFLYIWVNTGPTEVPGGRFYPCFILLLSRDCKNFHRKKLHRILASLFSQMLLLESKFWPRLVQTVMCRTPGNTECIYGKFSKANGYVIPFSEVHESITDLIRGKAKTLIPINWLKWVSSQCRSLLVSSLWLSIRGCRWKRLIQCSPLVK